MSEYGVTKNGFAKKRLDRIISDLQADLTEKLGFDVSLNPQSLLNVIITNYADRIAQLWEVAEQVYFSQYPTSAEGVNLDNVGQLAGLTREGDQRTKYLVLCTGKDEAPIPKGSVIASTTTPKIRFTVLDDYFITRTSFNKATIKLVATEASTYYTVTINGNSYSYLSGVNDTEEQIISALADCIQDTNFTVETDGALIHIACKSETVSNNLVLSENLTTHNVSTLILWQSEEFGKFVLPKNSITDIITTVAGFESCYNLSVSSYGRLRETDVEYRQSFLKKIASRSSCMLESITSSIMDGVDGVSSARGYENTGSEEDDDGRPPHSIEIVVDGGDDAEIASAILRRKSAGIGTFGNVSVDVPTSYGDMITIHFNRPENIYVWYKVEVVRNPSQPLPPNAVELIKSAIIECMSNLGAGDAVLPQDYISKIKELCTGIAYVDIALQSSNSKDFDPFIVPMEYYFKERNVFPTSRQKAVSSIERIEVNIGGS